MSPRRAIKRAWIIAWGMVIAVLLLGVYVDSVEDRQRDGVLCVVEQLSRHREITRQAHEAAAAHDGYTYPHPVDYDIVPITPTLAHACDDFLPDEDRSTNAAG